MKTEIRDVYLSEFQDMTVKERMVYVWFNEVLNLVFESKYLTYKPWEWTILTPLVLVYALCVGLLSWVLVPLYFILHVKDLKVRYSKLSEQDEIYGCYKSDCRVLVKEDKSDNK